MKLKILGISGIVLFAIAAYRLFAHAFRYEQLSQYGKGFVWGNVLLLLLGIFLMSYWYKLRAKAS